MESMERPPKPDPLPCNLCGRPGMVVWSRKPVSGQKPYWVRHRLCSKGKNLFTNYGVTCADFDKMLADQGGTCKFSWCDRPGVALDHDHDTGRVRGILCNGHNYAMGWVDEAIRTGCLDEIIEYARLDH